jgi:hypothetical protein
MTNNPLRRVGVKHFLVVLRALIFSLVASTIATAQSPTPTQSSFIQLYVTPPSVPLPARDPTGPNRIIVTPAQPRVNEPFYIQVGGRYAGICPRHFEGFIRSENTINVTCPSPVIGNAPDSPPVTARVVTDRVINIDFVDPALNTEFRLQLVIGNVASAVPVGTPTIWIALGIVVMIVAFLMSRKSQSGIQR